MLVDAGISNCSVLEVFSAWKFIFKCSKGNKNIIFRLKLMDKPESS
jgi:hypothetical protein